ncbi:MAG: hypothetical protein ACE147_07605 [Candidatus Methylomirabilales bacterium]
MLTPYHLVIHAAGSVIPGPCNVPTVHDARTQARLSLERNPGIAFVQVVDEGGTVIEIVEPVRVTD